MAAFKSPLLLWLAPRKTFLLRIPNHISTSSREFEQGTNQNRLREEDIRKIVDTFRKRRTVEKYSCLAAFKEIAENEFNLNIPRYVDTFEPEPEIDIAAVQARIAELDAKLAVTRKKMDGYLRDLGLAAKT